MLNLVREMMHNKRNSCTSISDENIDTSRASNCSTDKDVIAIICRVCHCSEPDARGNAALEFLNITPPLELQAINIDGKCPTKIYVCSTDVESGPYLHHNAMFNLGCSCKNDLARAHYSCALKWFISRGCTACEICGSVAENVRMPYFKKVLNSLKDYEELMDREAAYVQVDVDSAADPAAVVATIRGQKLSEISLWFNIQNSSAAFSQEMVEILPHGASEYFAPVETIITSSALECMGALLSTCLMLVFFLWLIMPGIGKRIAFIGFYFLLGDLCALSVVIFLTFVVPTRIKFGPVSYCAVLLVVLFLASAIWASRTRNARAA